MLPKAYIDNLKLRHQAYGVERRRNMSKVIFEHAPNFPLSVEMKDIDQAFQEWVESELDMTYDGKRLPTFKLFSNQRIGEYAQTWQHLDEVGNILMNFKTVTRETNPQKGNNQGEFFNIPGNRDYPMFMVPVIQENGQHAYDMYSMKQPFCVDMVYSVSVITNKYELINKANQLIHSKFKAINCYIAPHYHYMPMVLNNVSDESEYNIDDRKYYSQTYNITVKAYIILEEDFTVTRLPSRVSVRLIGLEEKKRKKRKVEELEEPIIQIEEEDFDWLEECKKQEIENGSGIVDKDDPFYNKKIVLTINYPICNNLAEFTIDTDMIIRQVEMNNVYDFVFCVNGERMYFEDEITIYNGDNIKLEICKDDIEKDASIILTGIDPNIILDSRYNPELSLDEITDEEHIEFNA